MFKFFNKKKKDNKGFTLVELVIVVAILAILVGILAPQYTKYVEKSRKAADASNLDNIVTAFKVAASDTEYTIDAGKYTVTITPSNTTITAAALTTGGTVPTYGELKWNDALKEYTGYDWHSDTNTFGDLKLKSSKWKDKNSNCQISATIEVQESGAVKVTYDPTSVKETTK